MAPVLERATVPARVTVLVASVAIVVCGCTYSVPLGGTAVGRGLPIGDRVLMAGLSSGRLPELSGTLPDAGVNPIPHRDSLTTVAGALDLFGVTVGLSESFDIGWSGSRGIHSM